MRGLDPKPERVVTCLARPRHLLVKPSRGAGATHLGARWRRRPLAAAAAAALAACGVPSSPPRASHAGQLRHGRCRQAGGFGPANGAAVARDVGQHRCVLGCPAARALREAPQTRWQNERRTSAAQQRVGQVALHARHTRCHSCRRQTPCSLFCSPPGRGPNLCARVPAGMAGVVAQ